MQRKTIVAGNWKMNYSPSEAKSFAFKLKEMVGNPVTDVVVCVPFLAIPTVVEVLEGTSIKVGAQNLHWEDKGAFTGEVSGSMLRDAGVEYVIIGHSERRQYFNETDETVNKKVHAAFQYGLKPIVCVGESLEDREKGITNDLVRMQTKIALMGLKKDQLEDLIIAYEPIWAIGTGKTATKEQANEVCKVIRDCVCETFGKDVSDALRIQYGGSVNPSNANELFSMSDIDGGLVGGASLKTDFLEIVNYKA